MKKIYISWEIVEWSCYVKDFQYKAINENKRGASTLAAIRFLIKTEVMPANVSNLLLLIIVLHYCCELWLAS